MKRTWPIVAFLIPCTTIAIVLALSFNCSSKLLKFEADKLWVTCRQEFEAKLEVVVLVSPLLQEQVDYGKVLDLQGNPMELKARVGSSQFTFALSLRGIQAG